MIINLWGFLTICSVAGIVLIMFSIYLENQKMLKQLEIDALKYENEHLQAQVPSQKLERRIEALEMMAEDGH